MRDDQYKLFALIGVSLCCAQQTERILQSAVDTVLDDERVRLLEQSEPERKQTLGDFLKRLKRRVKLPIAIKDRLYEFLAMRNRLVHQFDFDLKTEGRTNARMLLFELAFLSISITGLLAAVFQAWARDEHDQEFFEVEAEETRQIIKMFEKQFGKLAREILAARNSVRTTAK